jgi:cytoplasmic FMR1 interacting protein
MPDDEKTQYYLTQFEVYSPEIRRISDAFQWVEESRNYFVNSMGELIRTLAHSVPTTQYLMGLARLLDELVQLDMVKDAKACLNNDFSLFKRCLSTAKKGGLSGVPTDEETSNIQEFLKNRSTISTQLRDALQRFSGFEKAVLAIVQHCLYCLKHELFVLPEEKHLLLRVVAVALFIMDPPPTAEDTAMAKRLKKTVKLEPLLSSLRDNIAIPLRMDMTLNLYAFFARKRDDWGLKLDPDAMEKRFVLARAKELRRKFDFYVGGFMDMLTKLPKVGVRTVDGPETQEKCERKVSPLRKW